MLTEFVVADSAAALSPVQLEDDSFFLSWLARVEILPWLVRVGAVGSVRHFGKPYICAGSIPISRCAPSAPESCCLRDWRAQETALTLCLCTCGRTGAV